MTISSADFLSKQTDDDCCSVTNSSNKSHSSSTPKSKNYPIPFCRSSMHPSLPNYARTGRSTARYTPGTNRRLCAGVVALSTQSTPDSPGHHTHVLVTSSSRHPDRFVLPKGGWEQDESAEHAALREGWEEAGVVGKITKFLGQVIDPRPPNKVNFHDKSKKHKINGIVGDASINGEAYKPRAEYLYYEVEVEELATEYPESSERIRKWVTYEEAIDILSWRPEMADVLQLSQIIKGSVP